MTRLVGALGAGLLLLGLGVTGAGPAAAHSAPVASVPADKASIEASPGKVSITFNEELQPSFPSLTVVGPPDRNLWSTGKPVVEGNTISMEVGELGPAGEYTIAYRVTSADGHPVSGTMTFTLTKAGTGTPGPRADGKTQDDDAGDSGGVPLWVFIAGAVVLFGGGLAFALFGGKGGKAER
ncbi:copper resistance CopC family protein [Nocardia sp. NPDC048505]|uniref:copper resistance CopC family protein n=1 Tax=Nocardia sp. NPDC048505 TaxID=3155756 RepID=UPI0033EE1E7E